MLATAKQIIMGGNGLSYAQGAATLPAGTPGVIALTGAKFHFGAGLFVSWQPGVSATVTVLVTGDRIDGQPIGPQNWNWHDTLQSLTAPASGAGKNGNLAYPCSAL